MRKIFACAATATVALTLATGCKSDSSDTAARPPAAVPSASSAAPSTPAAPSGSPAPSQPPTANSPSAPARPPKPQKLKAGANGAKVLALQRRLAELGYWNGKADGSFGSLTTQAVYALQKAAGLGRDGVVGPKTQKALDRGGRPKARSSSGRVIEISLKRQLLMLVDDGRVSQAFNTSTGSMQRYEQKGRTFLADTPSGR